MTTLRDLKKVDIITTHLVYGFCRNVYNNYLPTDNVYYSIIIQPMIVNICIAFYWRSYQWCTDSALFKSELFKIDGNMALKRKACNGNIFIDEVISTGIHRYAFKFTGNNHLALDDGIIGIISEDDAKFSVTHPFILRTSGYGFGTAECTKAGPKSWGKPNSYGKHAKDGDIVEMIVDLEKMTLRYLINEEDQGIAHENIFKDRYRVAVYLYEIDCKIELIE